MFSMISLDRQIKTGHNAKHIGMILEAVEEVSIGNKTLAPGETIEVTKSEARRLLASTKKLRVKID